MLLLIYRHISISVSTNQAWRRSSRLTRTSAFLFSHYVVTLHSHNLFFFSCAGSKTWNPFSVFTRKLRLTVKKIPKLRLPFFYIYIYSIVLFGLWRVPACHCANVKALCEAVGFAEEAPLHRQSQRSVHNSNSCSCILIQSSGLSLKGSIFLHFRNYRLAREFGLKIQEAEAAPALSSPPQPQRLPSKLPNNCARLSRPVRGARAQEKRGPLFQVSPPAGSLYKVIFQRRSAGRSRVTEG